LLRETVDVKSLVDGQIWRVLIHLHTFYNNDM
jgi:hypothetical protein